MSCTGEGNKKLYAHTRQKTGEIEKRETGRGNKVRKTGEKIFRKPEKPRKLGKIDGTEKMGERTYHNRKNRENRGNFRELQGTGEKL